MEPPHVCMSLPGFIPVSMYSAHEEKRRTFASRCVRCSHRSSGESGELPASPISALILLALFHAGRIRAVCWMRSRHKLVPPNRIRMKLIERFLFAPPFESFFFYSSFFSLQWWLTFIRCNWIGIFYQNHIFPLRKCACQVQGKKVFRFNNLSNIYRNMTGSYYSRLMWTFILCEFNNSS